MFDANYFKIESFINILNGFKTITKMLTSAKIINNISNIDFKLISNKINSIRYRVEGNIQYTRYFLVLIVNYSEFIITSHENS